MVSRTSEFPTVLETVIPFQDTIVVLEVETQAVERVRIPSTVKSRGQLSLPPPSPPPNHDDSSITAIRGSRGAAAKSACFRLAWGTLLDIM